jgi:hypothetical protein
MARQRATELEGQLWVDTVEKLDRSVVGSNI